MSEHLFYLFIFYYQFFKMLHKKRSSHFSQWGLRVNWEKSKLSPVQRIFFLGVRLGKYDGTPHGRACPSSAELPEFLQRQECCTTETVSKAPGAYGIRSCSHAPRTSVPVYGCLNRYFQHGLWRYMQRAGSLGALHGAPTALAHQLPRAVDSASSLTVVPDTAVGQARASLHRQHSGCLVYQPVGRYTITLHVTARPPSPPLDSHAVQITARCPHPGAAQSCGRHTLTTAYIPRRMATPS